MSHPPLQDTRDHGYKIVMENDEAQIQLNREIGGCSDERIYIMDPEADQ